MIQEVFFVWPEVATEYQIVFESKAFRELKAERTRQYVSISIRGTTQLSDIRWGYEAIFRIRSISSINASSLPIATVVAAVRLWQASEKPPSLFVASGSNMFNAIDRPDRISSSINAATRMDIFTSFMDIGPNPGISLGII